MVFCNLVRVGILDKETYCHNPYFNRWFSAMWGSEATVSELMTVTILILIDGFLQYITTSTPLGLVHVTILILIDGFLQ